MKGQRSESSNDPAMAGHKRQRLQRTTKDPRFRRKFWSHVFYGTVFVVFEEFVF
jgi:Sirohaem synthase dimerisation region